MKEYINIISGIISILFLIILIQIEPLTNGNISELLGVVTVFFISFFIVRFILIQFLNSEAGEKIETEIQNKREIQALSKKVQNDIIQYEEAKNSFRYFSNNRLEVLYKELRENGIENMERLALEEIMVEKGLLTHSEMHEKFHMIKNYFNNK